MEEERLLCLRNLPTCAHTWIFCVQTDLSSYGSFSLTNFTHTPQLCQMHFTFSLREIRSMFPFPYVLYCDEQIRKWSKIITAQSDAEAGGATTSMTRTLAQS